MNITSAGTATPFTLRLRLHFKGARAAGVKGLAVVFLGAVFGVGSGVWPRK
jgi:hypothetical protein|tara:strand:- start:198 stop:350 length:153 start_codon:yes stop_codon:yes gene_type:complete